MTTCQNCGQSPCACAPAVLSGIQLVDSLLSNPTIDGPTINGGNATNLALVGAQVDCTSRGCTAGAGVCNDGLATNAQVCAEVASQISGSNPAFCAAVSDCILSDPAALCAGVATCIATTPGIIDTNGAFGVNARATTALYGVMRFATLSELENANCLLGIDPCTLVSFWNAPNLASAAWLAFANAVGLALPFSASFCTSVFACGAAPIVSPAFTGTPTAPTAAPGTNNTQIATTAFVQQALSAALTCVALVPLWTASGGNPGAAVRFLADDCQRYTAAQIVATGGGGGGGGGGGVFATIENLTCTYDRPSGVVFVTSPGGVSFCCSYVFIGAIPFAGIAVTFTVAQTDTNYVVIGDNVIASGKTVNGCTLTPSLKALQAGVGDPFTLEWTQSIAFVRCA